MNITLMSAYFPPEIGAASHLFYELGCQLVRNGHTVDIITSYPTYNVAQDDLPTQYRTGVKMIENMEGMRVIRIRTFGVKQSNPFFRGIGQLIIALSLFALGLSQLRKRTDFILVYSPPLFVGLVALALRLFSGSKVIVNVQDLFPQSAIDLGLLHQPWLIRGFEYLESYLYRHSDVITVHSEGNRDHVLRRGGDSAKTVIVPNYVDTNLLIPGNRENEFRKMYLISPDSFIVSFAGIFGYSQDIDTIIESAKLLQRDSHIMFYIVGDGVENDRLRKKAEGLSNVVFLPMQPKDRYMELLHASDVCLVTLRKEVKTPTVPSKILSIMAAGRPLIAGLPLDGDAPRIIKEAECGICVEPENAEQLAGAIEHMYALGESAGEFGRNGREYVLAHFSLEICTQIYEKIFTGKLGFIELGTFPDR